MSSESSTSTPTPITLRTVPRERTVADPAALQGPRDLPKPLTSLVGREADVAAACALLKNDGVRMLTLTGPGGVGKTRLALSIAETVAPAFADGVAFVPLAAISDPELVLPTIARELGLQPSGTQSAAELVRDSLRDRRLLLVVDNVEQVRPAATHLTRLLASCPGLVTLVTSRALLHVGGEQCFPVAPLTLPAASGQTGRAGDLPLDTIAASTAVQLFVTRAQAVDPRFVMDVGNGGAIVEICRRLDGLPLAIELAAVWARVLSPHALLGRLEPRLPLLRDGADDQPERLRNMRDAIAWSYDLLADEEARLFRSLAIFAGGFTLDAAECVAGVGSETPRRQERRLPITLAPHHPVTPSTGTLDLVASLVDKSLLGRRDACGETRFEMLQTVREFGLEQLQASGEAETIAARHAAWCVQLAEEIRRAGRLSHGPGLAALEIEQPNFRAALTWFLERGNATAAQHLAGALAEFWLRHNHYWAEGAAWLERALAAHDGSPTVARAEALVGLSMLQWPRRAFAEAGRLLDEAETVARAVGDAGALAYARLHQGYVAANQGDLATARARGQEALGNCTAIAQGFSCHGALWLLARVALAQGEGERATALYERLLTSARIGDDEISVANSLYGLAVLAERRGDLLQALSGFAEAAAVCWQFEDQMFASNCLDAAAIAAVALGQEEPAVRLFSAVDVACASVGVANRPGMHFDWRSRERARDAARANLDPDRFAVAQAAGAALSLDEAIAEARALAERQPVHVESRAVADLILTSREQDVLRYVAGGWSDKEIAAELGISRRTVSNHVAEIRSKLDVSSRAAAAAIAVRRRLI